MKSSALTYRRADASESALRRGPGMFAWFSRLAGRSERKHGAQAYPAIDAKTVIYAVGDIHGRADLLARMHEAIERDWRARPAERRLEIYLGDYVDRGPDSAAVIAMLRARTQQSRRSCRFRATTRPCFCISSTAASRTGNGWIGAARRPRSPTVSIRRRRPS